MDYIGGLSSVVSIVSFVIFAAGVMKVFQMATTLTEIKEILTVIKHNGPIHSSIGSSVGTSLGTPVRPSVAIPSDQSGEEMLRALSMELDHPVPPAVIDVKHES